MKHMKAFGRRGIALLLVLMMCLSLINLPVMAAELGLSEEPVDGIVEIEEVSEDAGVVADDGTETEGSETAEPAEDAEAEPAEDAAETEDVPAEPSEEEPAPSEDENAENDPEEVPGDVSEEETEQSAEPEDSENGESSEGMDEAGELSEAPETEEVPEAVTAFLSAVEALRAAVEALSETAAEEIYADVTAKAEACQAAFDAMDPADYDREDVAAAVAAMAGLMEYASTLEADTSVAMVGETEYDTLQLAIRNAEAGDTVVLLQDVTESVLFPAADVVLDLNGHTLTGSGKAAINIMALRTGNATIQNGTIVGAEGYRAIVASNVNLTLEGVTMNPSGSLANEGVQSAYFGGGCVYLDKGTLTVENCTFSGDAGIYKENASYMGAGKTRDVAAYGGHIWTGSDVSDVTINNSSFENSQSVNGAVYVAGKSLTVAGSTFANNGNGLQLNNANGVFNVTGCTFSGGTKAINATSGNKMKLNVTDSSFSGFTDKVLNSNGELKITGGSFSNNTSSSSGTIQLGSGSSLVMDGTELKNNQGSGVVETYSAANVTMKNVTASGNIGVSSMYSGGSVLNAKSINGKTVILENVTATGNENTKEHGGAFYFGGNASTTISITGCKLTGNTAKNGGGAIYLNNPGTTTITDTEISGNTANGTGKYAGGGIYVYNTTGTVTLAGTTRVYSNATPKATIKHQTVGAAADIALVSNNVKTDFASEDAVQRAKLVLNNTTSFTGADGITYTLTKSDAKGLHYSSNKKFYWPAGYYTVKVEPARVFVNAPAGSHTGEKDTVVTDLAAAVAAAQETGAQTIYVCGNVKVDMANAASLNSGIAFVRCAEHSNGHMFTIQGDVTLNGAHIDGSKVDGNAAMIIIPKGGHLTVDGDTLIENGKNVDAKGRGGAIYVHQGSLTMNGGVIDNNSAREGGGIYALGGDLVVFEGGTVSNNVATGGNGGGGAYIEATSSEFGKGGGRTYFENNVANQLGGGVFLVNGVNANTHHHIYKATFTGNKSYRSMQYYDGGAIYIQSGTTVHMKNVYVSGNTDSDSALAHNNYTAVAVCPTGELAVYELEGLLAVNNNGKVDIGVMNAGTASSVDPMVYLPSYAPGGGEVSYTYVNGTEVKLADHQFMKGYFKVKTVASESAIASAKTTAEDKGVVITGNYATQYGAGIMTNGILKIGTETTTLRVNKVWTDGAENHENDQILVYLTQDGKIVDQDFRSDSSVILNKDNNWSYTWTNLGDNFTWGVKEASVDGYTSDVKVEKDTEFGAIADKYYIATITNNPGAQTNRLVINKTAYGLDPDASYKFTLKLGNVGDKLFALQLDGTLYPIYNNEITFYLKDGQSAVVDGLPEGFTYEVTEDASKEYSQYVFESVTDDIDGSITVVDVVNMATINITVQKQWADTDDGAVRPTEIKINLLADGEVAATATVKPNEKGEWTHTFTELPKFNADGSAVKYSVEEVNPGDYNPSYELKDGKWVIVNTLVRGAITVGKQVVGGGAVAAAKEYTFVIAGVGNAFRQEVKVAAGSTATVSGLVPGQYEVTEVREGTDVTGYTLVQVEGEQTVDVVSGGTNNVTITNTYTRDTGSLKITKAVAGDIDAAERTFEFTIQGPKDANGTYHGANDTVTFVDGVATVRIQGAGSIEVNGLPTGTYHVTERNAGIAGYSWTVTGNDVDVVVKKDDAAEASITNTYTRDTGSLKITKAVAGDIDAADRIFEFTIEGPKDANGTYGTVAFVNGVATVQIQGAGSIEINGLPSGTYHVTERNAGIVGYRWDVTGNDVDVLVKKGDSSEAVITNTYTELPKGSLTIIKSVVGGGTAAEGKEFAFTVVDENGNVAKNIRGEEIGRITLKAGESVTLRDVVPGIYTVIEDETGAAIPGYILRVTAENEGKVEVTEENGVAVTVTNTYAGGSLVINKVVNGGGETAAEKEYTFQIQGPETLNGTYSGVTFENGKATVTIQGAGTVVIEGLPAGRYEITEDDATISGYRWSREVRAGETVAEDDTAKLDVAVDGREEATFTNTYTTPNRPRPTPDPDPDPDPTPDPDPDPDLELPDPDVPLAELPPVEMEDPEVPLAEMPPVELEDPDVPLADVPRTGEAMTAWYVLTALAAMGFVSLQILSRRKHHES